ncbi:unnamed protein product [Cyprideis torosa]|uniref:Uncharacterized protein n=1 Tax=Cyprideis torosa TaxID=163714 RepID=A0A7R8WKT5_9CRUS|nr:unnamed protein product [Cyprideis torosa]CAG0896457.1 unnamed protein product [Cyprideis torosa]
MSQGGHSPIDSGVFTQPCRVWSHRPRGFVRAPWLIPGVSKGIPRTHQVNGATTLGWLRGHCQSGSGHPPGDSRGGVFMRPGKCTQIQFCTPVDMATSCLKTRALSLLALLFVAWSGVFICYRGPLRSRAREWPVLSFIPTCAEIEAGHRGREWCDVQLTPLHGKSKAPCGLCGKAGCHRHRIDTQLIFVQPWCGIQINKRVDAALDNLFTVTFDKFIGSWYQDISRSPDFEHELRVALRHAIAILIRRFSKISLSNLILDKLVPTSLNLVDGFLEAKRLPSSQKLPLARYLGSHLHLALYGREAEERYVREVIAKIIPLIVPRRYLESGTVVVFLRELLANSILLPIMDLLADPDVINFLLIALFEPPVFLPPPSPLTPPPQTPEASVAPLEAFVERNRPSRDENNRTKPVAVTLTLDGILKKHQQRYHFMQFLISEGTVNLLQFYLDLQDLIHGSLFPSPELQPDQKLTLHASISDLYARYFQVDSPEHIPFDPAITEEVKKFVSGSLDDIDQIRFSRCLYQALEHVFDLLENTFIPLFQQSETCFRLIWGARTMGSAEKCLLL